MPSITELAQSMLAQTAPCPQKQTTAPTFNRTMRDSRKRSFDSLVARESGRFSRGRYGGARRETMLKKNGVKAGSARECVAEGILLESVLEGYAECFSADLAGKAERGMTERFETHEWRRRNSSRSPMRAMPGIPSRVATRSERFLNAKKIPIDDRWRAK